MKMVVDILEPKIGRKIFSRNMISLSCYYKGGYPPNTLVSVVELNENNEVTKLIASNSLYNLTSENTKGVTDPFPCN